MGLLDRWRRRRTDVSVRLNLPLEPMHRGDWYEDALIRRFKEQRRGNRMTGGGTELDADRRIVAAVVDVALVDPVDDELDDLIDLLVEQCAPRGSSLSMLGRAKVEFGECGVLALHLPAAAPPDVRYEHVPCTYAAMDFMEQLPDAADGVFVVQTWWSDADGTTVYISAPDLERARAIVEPMIAAHPVGAGHAFEVLVP
ncbi:hypothetical protein ACVWW9_000700 [Agrococcus sp. UYP33]